VYAKSVPARFLLRAPRRVAMLRRGVVSAEHTILRRSAIEGLRGTTAYPLGGRSLWGFLERSRGV